MSKEIVFYAEINGEIQELCAVMPSAANRQEGQKIHNKMFNTALSSGAMLRAKLLDFMRENGCWTDAMAQKEDELKLVIINGEKSLEKGGISLEKARQIAIDISDARTALSILLAESYAMDSKTAEGQADNQRFNYLVSACVVYNKTRKPVFSSLDDYLNNESEDWAVACATNMAKLIHGVDDDFAKKLPENKFLKEWDFVDENLNFLNEEGHSVDRQGRLVDEQGKLIEYDEKGKPYFVDEEGERVDKDGNYESQPFLDKDGKPIVKKTAKPKTRKPRQKKEAETAKASG